MGVSQRRRWGGGRRLEESPLEAEGVVSLAAWWVQRMAGGCSQVPSLGGSKLVHSWVSGVRDSLWARPSSTGNPGWVFLPHQPCSPTPQAAPQHHLLRVSLACLFSPVGGSLPCTFRTHLPGWPAVAPDHLIAHCPLPHPTLPHTHRSCFPNTRALFPQTLRPQAFQTIQACPVQTSQKLNRKE